MASGFAETVGEDGDQVRHTPVAHWESQAVLTMAPSSPAVDKTELIPRHPLMRSELRRLATDASRSGECQEEGASSTSVRVELGASVLAPVRRYASPIREFPPIMVFPAQKGIQVIYHYLSYSTYCM